MINYEALFKVSYGLYVVCSGSKEYGNGYISNTVFQVTSDPPRFATCCNKENHTAGMIQTSGVFSVSVLQIDAGPDTIGTLGSKSGKDTDKLKKAAEVKKFEKYECPTCGYIYDEEKEGVKFNDLPDDWVCPLCGEEKSEFIKL